MSEFVLTQAAKGDLLRILEYLEGDNPSAILKVVDALDDAMQLLAENPGIGHLRPDLTPQDVRFWSVFRLSFANIRIRSNHDATCRGRNEMCRWCMNPEA